ncbi:MAG TPA: TIM-barrel domain-containing protein [Polyangiales bacterium]|nr:TIM-barrel domain-containing protein [Polyangiales bacterium]
MGPFDDGVVRFVPEEVDPSTLPRSFALTAPVSALNGSSDPSRPIPKFGHGAGGYSATVPIDPGTSLYGTGEVAGPLLRNGFVTECWATQPFRIEDNGEVVANYDEHSKSLYQAHPWVLGVSADGSAFGVLADTTYRLEIDLRNGIRLSSAKPFAVIMIEGASPDEVVERLATLTGRIELPPHWALGYQQCRFSYYPDARVREIASELRKRSIPCDVIWVDIHYMDNYKVFTFDPDRFPDPKGTNQFLHGLGFKSVWILDPAVKVEPGYSVYDEGVSDRHFLLDANGQEHHESTWPGEAAFPDFTRPETLAWWTRLTVAFLEQDIDGLWVDLNEPSPILPLGAELPESLMHRGGGEIAPGTHAQYHNVYGLLMSKATHDAMRIANPERRPFVLSRSSYLGGQRYAATWTGDNVSSWQHLLWSVPMVLNLGLSGQPFSGPDIGGFAGTPSPELFAHWIGVGAFLPFCRTHNSLTGDQEPWSFGPAVEEIARTALACRYRLLPYLYTAFRDAATRGLPVARPLFFADPADAALRAEDHAFLLGGDLLVQPQLMNGPGRDFATPKGRWRTLSLLGGDAGGESAHPRLRLRDGAILPVGQGGQTAAEAFSGPLTLFVSLDESGRARGELYEDAGEGFGYLDGDYLLTTYQARRIGAAVEISVARQEGDRPREARELSVELLTDQGQRRAHGRDGERIRIPFDASAP